jgi:hypothetical protein
MTRFNACGVLAALASMACAGAHAATHDHLFTYGFDPAPDAPADANEAARFLTQATFGPTASDIARLTALGYDAWIEQQIGQAPTLGAQGRLPVEVDRDLEAECHLLREAPGEVDALADPRRAERHERHDVDGTDARVSADVAFHVDELERASDGGGRRPHHGIRGPGERHHAAVVGLVAAVVQQRHAIDLADGADDLREHLRPPALAEVRDALDQAGHVGHLTVR